MMNVGAEGGTVSELGSPLHPGRALTDAESRLWERVRPVLLASRNVRNQPARDDKVVAGWNGLAMAALAEAGAILDRPDLVAAAEAVAEYLADVHWNSASQVLVRVSHDSRARGGIGGGLLEDYAFCADGSWRFMASREPRAGTASRRSSFLPHVHVLWRTGDWPTLRGGVRAGFQRPGPANCAGPVRQCHAQRCRRFRGRLVVFRRLLRFPRASPDGRQYPRPVTTPRHAGARVAGWLLATAQAALAGPVEAAVAGPDSPLLRELHTALLKSPSPGLVIAVKMDDGAFPAGEVEVPLLLHRSGAPDGSAQVYLCRDMVCERPLSDVAAVQSRLAAMAAGD